jgi:DNA-binding transcriptional LysR family regulator
MLDLIQLRCFTTVATELSFSRAAVRLNMTQPPLSRQIKLLEHQLGVELFTRSTRSVALTAAGRAFFVEAQSLLERAQAAELSAKRFAQGDIGTVKVSFVPSAVYEFLPKVIAEIRLKQPNIDISLEEMNSFEQNEALRTRRIDLGIVRQVARWEGLSTERLLTEPFVVAVPAGHPLAAAPQLTVRDLHRQSMLMYANSAYQPFNELLTGMFRREKVTPHYVQWLGSTLTILALVDAGVGLALIPRSAQRIRFENIVFRDIELGRGVESELHMIWHEDNDNPAFASLLRAIQQAV